MSRTASDQAVAVRQRASSSACLATACAATASSSEGAVWFAVANAHAAVDSPCGLNSPTRGASSPAMESKRAGAGLPDAAYAQAVIDSP